MARRPRISRHLWSALAGWAVLTSASVGFGGTPGGPSVLAQASPARLTAMRETITVYGTVEFSPQHTQVLDLQAEGLVESVYVAAGQQVRKGAMLAMIRNTPNDLLELDRARIDAAFARRDVDRLRGLRARQLATNAEVQVAEQNLDRDEALLANVRKRLGNASTRTLRAPMDGVVEAVNVRQGDIVPAGNPVLRLAKGDRLRARLGVEAEDLPRVAGGQRVSITPVYGEAAPVTGQVRQIYRQIDPKTHLAEVVVPLPAVPSLLPGSMVRGLLVLRDLPAVLAVPRSAVLYAGGRPYVFVVDRGTARRRWVRAGLDDGRQVEIRGGLRAGELVVTVGNYELRDGMALRLQPGPGR